MKRSANFFSVLLINNSYERLNNSEVINNTITVCLQGKDWVYLYMLSHYKRVRLATSGFVQDTHKDYLNVLFCHLMAFPVTSSCTLHRNLKRERLGSNLRHVPIQFSFKFKNQVTL